MRDFMKETKRIDEKEPNMALNPALITTFHKGLLGGGAWDSKARKAMREKYYLPRSQFRKMDAPTLRGTRLNMAVKGLEFGGLSKTLLHLHQQARDVAKLGLREYETFVFLHRKSKDWVSTATHDGKDHEGKDIRLPEFVLAKSDDFELNCEGDDAKVAGIVAAMTKAGGAEAHAKVIIQQRRALRQNGEQYDKLMKLFVAARDMADLLTVKDAEGTGLQESIMAMHWDLLQNLGWVFRSYQWISLTLFPRQLDLGITAARNTSVEKFLTTRMRDRLKDEAADPEKRRKRDSGNTLLAPDLDKLVVEESKVNTRLSQVSLADSAVSTFGGFLSLSAARQCRPAQGHS